MPKFFKISCLLLSLQLMAVDFDFRKEKTDPWFTGSLLSPEGHTLKVGTVQLRPYLFASDHIGTYGHIWQRSATPRTKSIDGVMHVGVGLLGWLDFEFAFQGLLNYNKSTSAIRAGDLYATLGFQLLEDKRRDWVPDIRFFITQSFPFGHYDKLNPAKKGTDVSSSGSYETTYALCIQKTFATAYRHFIRLKFAFGLTYPTSVSIHGFNTYGGGFGATGNVKPGNKSTAILSVEYNLWKELAFALDLVGMHGKRARFQGNAGTDTNGNAASIRTKNLKELSIAPALEYNFAKDLGIIGGVWFTVLSRSDDSFFSAALSLVKRL